MEQDLRSDGLWDAQDVARYLKMSRSWVYHRAESGELPYRRIGGCLRFVPSEIRAYVEGERPNDARGILTAQRARL